MITAIGFSGGWELGQLAIQGLTGSSSAHVFGLVNDGITIIDATAKYGVKDRSFKDLQYDWIHFVQLNKIATHAQRIDLEALARKEIGKGYDFGFVFGWPLFGRKWQDDDSWACSELWGAKLIEVGILPPINGIYRLTPRDLRRRLEE
jgi:hypothetical protein